jgi:5-methyltetrahydrofolate--homocysteine methyltransferase
LTLDENGIPETAQGRINIAKKILKYAGEYGIGRESFLFDPLTMAVSAGPDSALVTLECVRRLKEELGVKTSLGVSNISFGLPNRNILNAAFLSHALDAGLDAAILKPNVNAVHQEIASHEKRRPAEFNIATDALFGRDKQFVRYIETYGGEHCSDTVKTKDPNDMKLGEAILKGLKQQAIRSVQRSLEQYAPLDIIEAELIPALNTAGLRFEQGTMYLPQLLMCAEAAKSAFTIVRPAMGSSADDTIGTVVIATVEGDVHDIGKNIVRALLENYRFHVIDLGKDVPARSVVEAVQKYNAKLAGLSALMTTTVVSMEKTIQALRKSVPDCKIMCGGAVLTKEYAECIGADCYAKDAMASVRYAQQVFGQLSSN